MQRPSQAWADEPHINVGRLYVSTDDLELSADNWKCGFEIWESPLVPLSLQVVDEGWGCNPHLNKGG